MTALTPEYWFPISHAAQLYSSGEVLLQLGGTYQKQSFLNRCSIVGVQGRLTLSVPLAGGREQQTYFRQVQIDRSQRWATRHLRTLRSCYGKAPFFDYYFPTVEKLLLSQHDLLAALNTAILAQVVQWLKWNGNLVQSDTFILQPPTTPLVLAPYVQVFADRQPFHPDASILDLLFCVGPSASQYLRQALLPAGG